MRHNIQPLLLLLLLLLLPIGHLKGQDTGREWLDKGNSLYEAGRHAEAVACYQKAAALDVAEAQFNLGYAYYKGEGIGQDMPSAAMWFKRAALQGFAKAEYNLAFCYMNGEGVPCNHEKALQWLTAAANHGFIDAQLTLSECYERGVLVEKNVATSKLWKEKALGTYVKDKTTPTARHAPVLKILYPQDLSTIHADVVKIRYQLIADGMEEDTKVVAMIDAEKVTTDGSRAVKQANVLELEVPHHDCVITLYAQNAAGNSEPVSVRLRWENAVQTDLPRLFCVAVGIGDYKDDKLPPLRLSTKDARNFASAVASKQGHPFADVQVKLLTDREATRADIFEAMEWLQQESTPNDVCIFFFAGHGYRDEKDRFYFMPYGGSTDKLYNCFSATDFRNMADDINCKFIVFADACYSAALLSGHRSASATHFVEQLRRTKNGMMLYASSASDTKSKEDPAWGNGAFTKALVEAFNGAARQTQDEGLSTQALEMYLYKEVRRLTNYKQTPIFINPNGMEHFNIFTYDE